jgi:PAS domain S-box-containing protein
MAAHPQSSDLIALSDAVLEISGERDLRAVLRLIVDEARKLVGARYGALAVPDATGNKLATFVTSGMPPGACPGDPPTGRGILGVVRRDGESLRLADLTADPRSVGFPPGHPPMRSFLGVPVARGGDVLGDLYLTEKVDGTAFSVDDMAAVELLARHAAIAIHNARLSGKLQLSETRYRLLVNQSPLVVFVLDEDDRFTFVSDRIEALTGRPPDLFMGLRLRDAVLPADRSVVDLHLDGLRKEGRPRMVTVAVRDTGERVHFLELTLTPAPSDLGAVHGVGQDVSERQSLMERIRERSTQLRSTLDEQQRLREFVGMIIQAQEEERRRIAGDLHDTTVQTLTAIGRRLTSIAAGLSDVPEQEELIELSQAALEEADEVRRLSRNLRPSVLDHLGLDAALRHLARELQESGVATEVAVEGNVERLDDRHRTTIFRIAQEAITNIRRHSGASDATVTLCVDPSHVELTVVDNGEGFEMRRTPLADAARGGHLGLAGMSERAAIMGGSLDVQSAKGKGTEVRAKLPIDGGGGPATHGVEP